MLKIYAFTLQAIISSSLPALACRPAPPVWAPERMNTALAIAEVEFTAIGDQVDFSKPPTQWNSGRSDRVVFKVVQLLHGSIPKAKQTYFKRPAFGARLPWADPHIVYLHDDGDGALVMSHVNRQPMLGSYEAACRFAALTGKDGIMAFVHAEAGCYGIVDCLCCPISRQSLPPSVR
jgi:hypothetical protein